MTQVSQDCGDLVKIVAPVLSAMPQLLQIIQQRDATIAVLVARINELEGVVIQQKVQLAKAEQEKEEAGYEIDRLWKETLRLESKLP